jgi:hypothetical protein
VTTKVRQPPQDISVALDPIELPTGTVTIQLVQQQPKELDEDPVMHTDFAFVPNGTVRNPNAIRTVVMFRMVDNGAPFKYPQETNSTPLNEMMTDEDSATGVEEGWVMDIDPGVFVPVGGLDRGDFRREKTDDPVVTPFYGDSGSAIEYRYEHDNKAGYVDTPSHKPDRGKTMTYYYQVVLVDTSSVDTSSVGAPLGTLTWSFDIVTDDSDLSSIQKLVQPQPSQGGGDQLEQARFTDALAKFDSYYRNPSGHTKPIAFDANHFLYELGSVPLAPEDHDIADLLAGLGDPPTAERLMALDTKCKEYIRQLEERIATAMTDEPNSALDVWRVKLGVLQRLAVEVAKPLAKS